MQRTDKERVVAELTERLRSTQTLIVADYRGLSVTEIDKLRGDLLEHGARFSVVKNTLTRRAAEAAGVEPLLALIDGPTAIAFLEADSDPVAVAKALDQAARTESLVVRGGILDGTEVSSEEVGRLAKLPPAEMLHAQLVSAVAGPLTMVVGLFTAPLRDLVGVLDARIRQLEEQGEGAPGEQDAPAEEAVAAEPEEPTPEAHVEQPEPDPEAEAPAEEPEPTPEAQTEQPEAEAQAEPEQAEDQPQETQEGEEQ